MTDRKRLRWRIRFSEKKVSVELEWNSEPTEVKLNNGK